MYRITQDIKYSNITSYGYGRYGCFVYFLWYAMSSGRELNMVEFVRTD